MDATAPDAIEAQFDELIRTMLRMRPRRREVTVRDEEGQIEVCYDAEGRLSRVALEPRWEERIEASALPGAILATVAEAQFEASGLNDDDRPEPDAQEVAAKREEILRLGEAAVQAPADEVGLQDKIDNLPNLFGRLDAAIDQLGERLASLEAPVSLEEAQRLELEPVGGTIVRSENAMVSVTVHSGAVVDVDIHRNWLPGRSGHVLTECFAQIIGQLHDVENN